MLLFLMLLLLIKKLPLKSKLKRSLTFNSSSLSKKNNKNSYEVTPVNTESEIDKEEEVSFSSYRKLERKTNLKIHLILN